MGPPPVAASASYVYLLACKQIGDFYAYVGETDNIAQRWAHHCSSRKPEAMLAWRVHGKSTARRIESQLIAALAAQNVPMLSTSDASHIAFGHAQHQQI